MNPPNFILALFGLLICLGCNVSSPPDEPPEPTLPPLEANFPYEKLGSGKIVFNRLGPPDDNYSSVYVADIDSRRSWAIEIGNGLGPAVSPDGTRIAFSKSAGGQFDIHIINIDGSGPQNVTNLVGQDWYPSWTPDSQQIFFCSALAEELSRQSPVSNPIDRQIVWNFRPGSLLSPVAVSPSLQLALICSTPGISNEVFSMNWNGTTLVRLTWLTAFALWSPCWSPDGTRIAFMRGDDSGFLDIFVMDADGGNLRSVASVAMEPNTRQFEWLRQFQPLALCWSPDGTKLLFNKIDGDYCLHLYVMNADGTDISQVTFANTVTDRSVSWSRY